MSLLFNTLFNNKQQQNTFTHTQKARQKLLSFNFVFF